MNITKIISTTLKDARRLVKFFRFGSSDVRENYEASPFGLDSNPVKDTVGVYSSTTSNGQGVILGYVHANKKADVGEFRTYGTDTNGAEVFYTWIKSDGTMEIGGDTDNMVRFSELKTAFDQLKSDFDSLVSSYNGHIHITTATVGATPTVGVIAVTTSTGSPTTANIDPSKIDEIKTI